MSELNKFVSVSGGLDSTALSILCSREKKWKYIFADTGDEFPQVYDHLEKMEKILDIKIIRTKQNITLGQYEIEQKFFPSPKKRFCTRIFKIEAIQKYCVKYIPYKIAIGLRADEDRKGGLGSECIYPLKEANINKNAVFDICKSVNLVPQYPWYMSRGGCYSCFFKKKNELLALAKYEPELFIQLIEREEKINAGMDIRKKYYSMFENVCRRPLRQIKIIADSIEQIEMFEKVPLIYKQDCGVFCRK